MNNEPLVKIENLNLEFNTYDGPSQVLFDMNLTVHKGDVLGLVGETGSGKTMTALSIPRLIPMPPGRITSGQVLFEGENIITKPEREMQKFRAEKLGMIFQDPVTNLNPVFTIREQIVDAVLYQQRPGQYVPGRLHSVIPNARKLREQAHERAIELMNLVGLPEPDRRIHDYPHEFSGGMRQRVLIAMALAGDPHLLIADEPTTALDVTVQAQILDLLKHLVDQLHLTVLLITHDLGVVAKVCNRVTVMHHGRVVEEAETDTLFRDPKEDYTRRLIDAVPKKTRITAVNGVESGKPLVEVRGLKKYFPIRGGVFNRKIDDFRAVDDVSFVIPRGKTLGLVGESGSGKSTTGRCLLRLLEPTGGEILFDGVDLTQLSNSEMRKRRTDMQMIYQAPAASLNGRMTVGQIVAEPLWLHSKISGNAARDRVMELLEQVGMKPEHFYRFPHEFSGGQQQRVGIARALAVEPKMLVLDEPTSALDVSVQKQVLELLQDLQTRLDLTYLFISHDLGVIRYLCDEVCVMYLGKIVERGKTVDVFNNPQHEYTQKLINAIPEIPVY